MATVILLPDADGSVLQWTPHPASDPLVWWNKVITADGDTTYVHEITNNEVVEFNHATSPLLTGATITNVRVTARARKVSGLNTTTFNIGVKIGVTRYPGATPAFLTTSYADYGWNWVNNPADLRPWEKSDIDSLQSSFQAYPAGFAPQVRITYVYITVTYTPAAIRPPRPTATVGLPHII